MTQMIRLGEVQEFDEEKRELLIQVLPWNQFARTARGWEGFEKGFSEGLDPGRFVLRQRHQDPPTGRGLTFEETDSHLLMRFRVAKTAAGDEQLTLYKDGIETGASIGFEDGDVKRTKRADGVMQMLHRKPDPNKMLEVSTTYIPAFGQESTVLQAFSQENEAMAETEAAAAVPAAVETPVRAEMLITRETLSAFEDRVVGRIETMEEKTAALMAGAPAEEGSQKAQLKREVKLQIRELADVITTGNEGVVPDATVNEMLGEVDTGRPFLNNTRRLTAPSAGTRLLLPRLVQGPIVDLQESEKEELASRATIIDTVDFPMLTVGGAADISMQLLKRSSPEFRQLWLRLLGQAYAQDTENRGIDALLAETISSGGALDVETPQFGGAFTNAATATGRTMAPNRMFLSTAAVAKFINAVEPAGGGGRLMYPGIASVSGLRTGDGTSFVGGFNLLPVWTPELDDETPDVIVGPSDAFAWAEDGTYTLEADVPSKFGRDIGLAGMIWYAVLYPLAFTSYTLAA